MPRKDREREGQGPREARQKKKAAGAAEPMPQVWLPDQPETPKTNDFPFLLPPTGNGPAPTDEEQRQMAELWAKEEQQAPRGWDEDQELDYSEVVRKREEREMSEPRESVDTPDLFKYAQSTSYSVRCLGQLTRLPSLSLSPATPTDSHQTHPLHLIDKAQKQGLLPWVTSEADQRVFCISKYGIKVTDAQKQRVFSRHALHYIINITYYEDTYGKHMLAVRVVGGEQQTQDQELHIYEAKDEAEAKDICLTLAQAFETVHKNMQLQQNLTSDLR